MAQQSADIRVLADEEVANAIEQYKTSHPEVEEALRLFEISDEKYQATLKALYGRQVTWTNSANESATRPS